ncbi:MAG: type II toxin-antitoxin system RelE/ParE family toxin [Deltaproteobacteria bacterium]|nr:type II toxin-antitoxin system RelE/ParE family toxin [Deltaproteobacteria bacterium]
MILDIRFFQTARGDEPVKDYIRTLPAKERARIEGCLYTLGITGRLDMPHGRKLAGYKGLYEVRSGRHRILYGIHDDEAIMSTAFVKKSQETPRAEIEVALRRLANYVSQGG